MPGRKPLPAELHELEKGKLYGEVAERVENTPKAKKEMRPRCPQRLTPAQRKVWRQYAVILKNYNLFTIANAPIMEFLAIDTAFFYELYESVIKKGPILTSEGGNPYQNPSWQAMNKTQEKIMKCLSELGLSSSGLARIGSLVAGAQRKKSEMEGLID